LRLCVPQRLCVKTNSLHSTGQSQNRCD
jgi:hypothetical protein